MKKQILLYGVLLGLLIVLLKFFEYKFIIRDYAFEIYAGLIALIFAILGIWLGLKLTRKKEVIVVKEILKEVVKEIVVDKSQPFVLNEKKLTELGLTQREHEILSLIAKGHSNKEIADKLFISLNTIKTHSSRLFEKLGVNRRTQAVQKGKELRIIP